MEYVELGQTGPVVSRLALGTWTFAGGSMWGAVERKQCLEAIQRALDAGITLFDSAPTYGNGQSEEILGEGLTGWDDRVVVASKCRVDGLDRDALRNLVDGSRRRLGRDRIDIMQIHWPPGNPDQSVRALEWLAELQIGGAIGFVGVCNYGVYDLAEADSFDLVSNQLPYNVMWRAVEDEIVGATKKREMGIMTYSTLMHGLLGGRYRKLEEFPDGRARTRHFGPHRPGVRHQEAGFERETQRLLDFLHELSSEAGVSILTLGLQFNLARSFVDTVLVGARSANQVEEISDAYHSVVPEEVIAQMAKASEALKTRAAGNPDLYQTESRIRYTTPE